MKIVIDGKAVEVTEAQGIPSGGTAGQVLSKVDDTDYNVAWADAGSGSSKEVYSTEETRVGTWINGKPLYRKVSSGVFGSGWTSIEEIPDVDTVTFMQGVCTIDVAKCVVPDRLASVWFRYGAVSVLAYDSTYANKPVLVVTEYTKTTDEATS